MYCKRNSKDFIKEIKEKILHGKTALWEILRQRKGSLPKISVCIVLLAHT